MIVTASGADFGGIRAVRNHRDQRVAAGRAATSYKKPDGFLPVPFTEGVELLECRQIGKAPGCADSCRPWRAPAICPQRDDDVAHAPFDRAAPAPATTCSQTVPRSEGSRFRPPLRPREKAGTA